MVIDATGLRVYGAGEWHGHKHRGQRRRRCRQRYLGVTEQTKEIVGMEATASHVHDSQVLSRLLTQIPAEGCQVSGDGASDTKACYKAIDSAGRKATIPPPSAKRDANEM